MSGLKQARKDRQELEEFSELFHSIRDNYRKLPEPKPALVEYFHSHVIHVDAKIYSAFENALKPFARGFNPITLRQATHKIINALLLDALNDKTILSSVLVACGKTTEEARDIINKMAEVTE